jgi:hypothetical protein
MRTLALLVFLTGCHASPAPSSHSAWSASCPVAGVDGLCIELVAAPGDRCEPLRQAVVRRGPVAAVIVARLDPLEAGDAVAERFFASPAPKVSEAVPAWLTARSTQLGEAREHYRRAVDSTSGAARARAAVRVAWLYDDYAAQVRALPVPADIRGEDREVFCRFVAGEAVRLTDQARLEREACREALAGDPAAAACEARMHE